MQNTTQFSRRAFMATFAAFTASGLAACATNPGNGPSVFSDGYNADREWRAKNPAKYDMLFKTMTATNVSFDPAFSTGSIVMDKSRHRLYYVTGKGTALSFAIALGKPGWETPSDDFVVWGKDPWPRYNAIEGYSVNPGLDNPLGAREIGIGRHGNNGEGFFIHGTNQPWLIGTDVSHGCIRMNNADVVYLYEKVGPGTKVFVRDHLNFAPVSAPANAPK